MAVIPVQELSALPILVWASWGRSSQSLSQGIGEALRQGRQTYSHGRLYKSPSRPSAPGVCEQPAPHWDRRRGPAHWPTPALSKEMTVGGASSLWLLSLLSFFFCMSNKY